MTRLLRLISFVFMIFVSLPGICADKTEKTGVFRDTVTIGALDKVTARTSEITLKVGEPVKVGSLIITALRAWKANIDEDPEAKVYFKITEIKTTTHKLDTEEEKAKRTQKKEPEVVFEGWMFASAPSLNSLAHPIYNIWVKDVSGEKNQGIIYDTQTLDEKTSDKIDDLIDQLLDGADDTGTTEDKAIDIPESLDNELESENDADLANLRIYDEKQAVEREINALFGFTRDKTPQTVSHENTPLPLEKSESQHPKSVEIILDDYL